jgi:preprotein translocase subunit SecF
MTTRSCITLNKKTELKYTGHIIKNTLPIRLTGKIAMGDLHTIRVFGFGFDHRWLDLIPIALLLLSIAFLVNQYVNTGEWFKRSIDLRGGTLLTIKTANAVSVPVIEESLAKDFGSVSVRGLRGFGEHGASVEMDAEVNYTEVIERLENEGVEIIDFSVENIGPALGSLFWSQAQIGIIVAFILMGLIAFVVFRTFVPSFAIIISAASDIMVTLAMMQVFGIEFSLASLGALLMLIGYSVDTDIMLTSRMLRETEQDMKINERLFGALKTGLTMTLTSIGAVTALLVIPLPPVLTQIASVILIGLSVDILNTWMLNSVLLRWYCESRGVL